MSGGTAATLGAGEGAHVEPSASDIRLVIAASSAGTIFEWYDFFIYGALGIADRRRVLSHRQRHAGSARCSGWSSPSASAFCPLGAILFGYLGDKLGRKYSFLVTVTLMGIATAGVGFVPSAESIGMAAPVIVILLRRIRFRGWRSANTAARRSIVAEHSPAQSPRLLHRSSSGQAWWAASYWA